MGPQARELAQKASRPTAPNPHQGRRLGDWLNGRPFGLRVVVALGKTGYVPSAVPKPGESLADLAPSAAAKWDQTANGDLTPDMVTVKSHKRVDWVCEVADDHRWCPHGSSRLSTAFNPTQGE